MSVYDIEEVIEYSNDLKRAWRDKDDTDEFNQAVMRLCDAVQQLSVIDDFKEIGDE